MKKVLPVILTIIMLCCLFVSCDSSNKIENVTENPYKEIQEKLSEGTWVAYKWETLNGADMTMSMNSSKAVFTPNNDNGGKYKFDNNIFYQSSTSQGEYSIVDNEIIMPEQGEKAKLVGDELIIYSSGYVTYYRLKE